MMLTALYYPHTVIRSRNLLKTALLLWDSVECIVPRDNWRVEHPFKEKSYNEAIDLIVRPRVPNNTQREFAHTEVMSFLKEERYRLLAQTILPNRGRNRYLIYPEKFLRGTWHALERGGLAQWDAISSDYGVPPALGLLMMSSLADACAGTQKQKVTDRVQAYSLLEKAKATLIGAPYVEGMDASQVAPKLNRLVTLSLQVLNAKSIPIKKLIGFRRREAKGKTADYRTLRKNYMRHLNKCIKRIRTDAKTKDDVREIEREFKADLKDDLLDLRHELNLASKEPLFSKEMAFAVMAVGGALMEPISGITNLAVTLQGIGIIPLVKTKLKHKEKRRKALRNHQISWLYLTQEKGITVR